MQKRVKRVTVPATANNITKAIVNFLLYEGHTASRINVQGQWDEVLQAYRKSGSRNGYADISAGIKGEFKVNDDNVFPYCQFVAIEIKKGKDRQSDDQIEFQKEVEAAGGIYLEVPTYIWFLNWYHKQSWIARKS